MENKNFQLYRIQLFDVEPDMYDPAPSQPEVLRQLFPKRLERATRERQYFTAEHQIIDNDGVLFEFGRSSSMKRSDYDGKKFIEVEHPDYPHVLVFADYELQILAVEIKSRFASTIESTIKLLKKIISSDEIVRRYKFEVDIQPLRDPEEFIKHLEKASAVSKFFFSVGKPNVYNPELKFLRPIKRMNIEANSVSAKAELSGLNMKRDILVSLSRVAASTGNDAGAWLKIQGKKRFVRKSIGKNHAQLLVKDDVKKSATEILNDIRRLANKYFGK